jgi:hypothetical protein
MRSPVNLYRVAPLEEPSPWASDPICEPDYRALSDVVLGFDDALAKAILLSDRYETKVTILADPGPHDLTGRLFPIASVIPAA